MVESPCERMPEARLPIDGEQLEGCRLVAHGAGPGGLLLIHLQEEDGIEALQVGTGQDPAGYVQTHLHQLAAGEKSTRE